MHKVTLRIYGQDFTFQASDYEATRLICASHEAAEARNDVRLLEEHLAAAKLRTFDPTEVSRIRVERLETAPAVA